MAVSYQWFVQWINPKFVFDTTSTHYQNYNMWRDSIVRLNSPGRENFIADKSNSPFRRPFLRRGKLKHNDADRSRVASLAVWLALAGTAHSHSHVLPADTDTLPFVTLYKWKQMDFEFPSPVYRKIAIDRGWYIPSNVVPLGIEVWGSRVWVSLPAWRRGVPATLGTAPREGGQPSPPLKPYPNWNYHTAFNENRNCSGLTSVFRMSTDQCRRLWVLDSGQIDLLDEPKQLCPPSLVVFDMTTDTLLSRYWIPKKFVLQNSLFVNIIIDSSETDCSDLHAYIADTWRFGLLVFRERDARFWRFSHHLFYPDPLASNFTLHGLNFQWTDGIFGLSLSPKNKYHRNRILYFHSLSSFREFYVLTSILKDPSKVNKSASNFNLVGDSRSFSGQSSASVIGERGVMFYGLVSKDSIGCWNTKKPYNAANLAIVAQDSDTLVFPNDLKIDREDQNLWIISNKLPMFQAMSLNYDEYNYRIMYANTEEAVQGTVCDQL